MKRRDRSVTTVFLLDLLFSELTSPVTIIPVFLLFTLIGFELISEFRL